MSSAPRSMRAELADQPTILASGNLATPIRTIAGLLGQLAMLEVAADEAVRMLTGAGLPELAYDDPEFPISLKQELKVCCSLVNRLPEERSPITLLFRARHWLGLDAAGVMGLALRHAPDTIEAARFFLRYPQLAWGHSRLVISKTNNNIEYLFTLDRPAIRGVEQRDLERLWQYSLTLDLISTLQLTEDGLDNKILPELVTLPFPLPDDWDRVAGKLPYPVRFNAQRAALFYPLEFACTPLPRARPVLFKTYTKLADKLSQMLVDDVTAAERVRRWLWTRSPPLRRAEVATLMSMSERSLTRQLHMENTSFSELVARVQDQRGKNLLRDSALSIADVADHLGYGQPATFARAFTRHNGISPQKWRNELAMGEH